MKATTIKLIRKTISVLGNIISIALLVGVAYFVAFGGYKAYRYLFTQIEMPFSISLTNFSRLEANGNLNCDIWNKDTFPVVITISRPGDQLATTRAVFESPNGQQFSISFPDGTLTATKYFTDGSSKEINFERDSNTINGNAERISIDYRNSFYLSMTEYFCEPTIDMSYPGIYDLISSPDSKWMSAAGFEQDVQKGSKIYIVITNPKQLTNVILEDNVKEIVFTYISKYDFFPLRLFSQSPALNATMPSGSHTESGYQGEGSWIYTDEIEIENPAGNLKFGNDEPTPLVRFSSGDQDTIRIPKTTIDWRTRTYMIKWKAQEDTTISGTTRSLLRNGEEQGKSPWYQLPEYVQAGLFGLLLSLLGGMWAVSRSIGKKITSFIPFWSLIDPSQPLKGSFVCVTDSGTVIAGELFRKPARNYPYYLIRNARRKVQVSENWDKQIISEIKIRQDAVEQSYFL